MPSGFFQSGSYESNDLLLANTLSPLIVAIEEALNDSLLLEIEKDNGYYFRFDTREFTRSSEAEKTELVINLLNAGILSLNEARSILDYNSVDKNYFKHSIGNSLIFTDSKKIFNINTNTMVDIDDEQQWVA